MGTDSEETEPDEERIDADTPATATASGGGIHSESFRLDRQHGSGANTKQEDWVANVEGSGSHDGRAHTRTTFYASDTDTIGPGQQARDPEDRRSWSDLAKWNDGMYSDLDRKQPNREADRRRWLNTFGTRVQATDLQLDRAQWLLNQIDTAAYCRSTNTEAELLIMAALSLSIDVDVTNYDNRSVERMCDAGLLSDLGADKGTIRSARTWIRTNYRDILNNISSK